MSNIKEIIGAKFTAIADAIRTKKHTSDLIPIDNYEEEILSIEPIYDTITLTKNGEHDVKDYKKALVEVDVDYLKQLYNRTVTEVFIPTGVTKIPQAFFKNITSLTLIKIPEGITEIDMEAFRRSDSVSNSSPVTCYLPSTILKINTNAFLSSRYSGVIRNLYFAGTYEDWCVKVNNNLFINGGRGDYMLDTSGLNASEIKIYLLNKNGEFEENNGEFVIPEEVSELFMGHLFINYGRIINKLVLPKSLTSISKFSFQNIGSVVDFYINKTIFEWLEIPKNSSYYFPSLLDTSKVYMLNENGEFYDISEMYEIPEGVTVWKGGISNLKRLKQVTLPTTLTTINGGVLEGCGIVNNEKVPLTIIIKAVTPPSLNSYFLQNYHGTLERIYVPKGTRDTYISATNWSNYADIIVEPNTITFNVDSTMLNNENYQYSVDSGKTFKTFVSNSLILDNVNVLVFKNNDTVKYMNIGTTSGGSEIGSFVNSTLTYNTTENLTLHITLATA